MEFNLKSQEAHSVFSIEGVQKNLIRTFVRDSINLQNKGKKILEFKINIYIN